MSSGRRHDSVFLGGASSAALAMLLLAAAMASPASVAAARRSDQRADGREILRERQARHRIESDEHISELVVTARNGRQRQREWISYRLGWGRDANRLIRFTDPAARRVAVSAVDETRTANRCRRSRYRLRRN